MLGVRVAIEKRSAGGYIIRDDRGCSSGRVERRDFCARRRDQAGRPGRVEDRRRGRNERTERKTENKRKREKEEAECAERTSGGRTSVAFDMDRR